MALTVDEAELIARALDSRVEDVYTAELGEVQSYDPVTRTADIRVIPRRGMRNEGGDPVLEELPILPSVPVAFPMGGGSRITWPIAKGDTGLVTFLRSSVGAWRTGGGVPCDPGDVRVHHPAHAVFHAGASVLPDASSTPGSDANAIILEAPEIRAGVNATEFVALANLVKDRLDALQSAHDLHKHATAGVGAPSVPDTLVGPLDPVAATKLKAE